MPNNGPGYAKHPEHTVAVASFAGRVVVKTGDQVLADTRRALEVRENGYAPVYYVPREDVRMARLTPSTHVTHCPFKGDASYFDLADGASDAVWSYEHPFDEVAQIRDHLAFYATKVSAIDVIPDGAPPARG